MIGIIDKISALMHSIPLIWAKIISIIIFLLLILLTVRFPKQLIMQGAPKQSIWYDLRLYAVIALVIQIIFHIIF